MRWLLFVFLAPYFLLFPQQEFTLFVKTQSSIKPIYLEFQKGETLRNEDFNFIKKTIEFDLANAGHFTLEKTSTNSIPKLLIKCLNEKFILQIEQFGKKRDFEHPVSFFSKQELIQTVHEISDFLTYELTGEYGIASERIVYTVKDPSHFSSELLIKHFDQNDPIQLTFDGHYKMNPLFISSTLTPAQEILFVSYQNGQPKIFRQKIGEKKADLFIQLRGSQFLPCLSPHGEFLSFISDASGSVDLFIQRLGENFSPIGKPMQIFSANGSVQATSSFNHKSSTIAFVSDFEKKPRVYQLDLLKTLQARKKSNLTLLTPIETEATCPAFSPDGKKLAYCSLIDGVRQIFILDLENNLHYPITEGPHHKENPSWASNSLHLAYNTTCTENEIYIINLQQKKPIKITEGYGLKHYPCWERIKKRKIKDSM
jgi:TolB protein